MAATPEKKVKDAVRKILDARGVYYHMPVSNGMGTMGFFDIVCSHRGWFIGIECKSNATTKPTPLQTRNAKKALAAGGLVFLAHIDNLTELADTIDRIKGDSYGLSRCSVWPFDCPEEDS
jgi:hypothetical protein